MGVRARKKVAGNCLFYEQGQIPARTGESAFYRKRVAGNMQHNGPVQTPQSPIDTLVCAVLRAESPSWPFQGETSGGDFLARARTHGVMPLLNAKGLDAGWPAEVRDALRQDAIQRAIWELRHQRILDEVLQTLARADVRPVLIKGTATAYSLYADPALRTRADTDMLIYPQQRAAAGAVLESLGFEQDVVVSGDLISYQCSFSGYFEDGTQHSLDVHWKINNSQLLSRLLTHEELHEHAQPLPSLCAAAIGAGAVHNLFITIFHRASHIHNPYRVDGVNHFGGDRLIWLHDVHLLAQAMDDRQWRAFIQLAERTEMASVCLDALHDARDALGTVIPDDVSKALVLGSRTTAPARYLAAGKLQQQWMDFKALDGSASRLHYLIELLFPAASYMRHKYPGSHAASLPWLYLRRAVGGARKALARRGASHQGSSAP